MISNRLRISRFSCNLIEREKKSKKKKKQEKQRRRQKKNNKIEGTLLIFRKDRIRPNGEKFNSFYLEEKIEGMYFTATRK